MNTLTRIVTVACGTDRRKQSIPRIRLAGLWLQDFGFTTGIQIIAEYDAGRITFALQSRYTETYFYPVGHAVHEGSRGIIPIQNIGGRNAPKPCIEIKGLWLETLGFTAHSVLVVRCEQGVIEIRKVDFNQLGF